MTASNAVPELRPGVLDDSGAADALVLVGPVPAELAGLPEAVRDAVAAFAAADPGLGRGDTAVVACAAAPGGRVVVAPTGELEHWTDDVRRIGEATLAGVVRAARCGARRPAVMVGAPTAARFAHADLVAAAAALQAGWRHPQLAAAEGRLQEVALIGADARVLERARAFEVGRAVARDLTAGDPEFMAPEGFAAYCERAFDRTAVQVEVDRDGERIAAENPLLGAIVRASMPVERHHPRIVVLSYDGGGGDDVPHYLFAGKGVTYDTGGADLKVGGVMAGMSMDKGGAAGVAGFFGLLAAHRPEGLRATAWLGCVRNSIGAEACVADEVVTSRGGVDIVIGNTDAEGRMVLGDMLAGLRRIAEQARRPVMMSVATLTGHVGRAYGPYASVMANGTAVDAGWPQRIQRAGEALGEPFEWSSIRRDDYRMIAPRFPGGPVVQCNNAASVNTPRGHQFAFCFLEKVSGLDRLDVGAERPVPFLHLDIATAVTHTAGPMAGLPTGSPVPALAGALLGWSEG